MNFSEEQKSLLYVLQRGLPLDPRPLAAIGAECGLSEKEVSEFIALLFADGQARRLGAVFDARRLGYQSVLCATSLPDPVRMAEVAEALAPHPGITHCYERGWPAELDCGKILPGGQNDSGIVQRSPARGV